MSNPILYDEAKNAIIEFGDTLEFIIGRGIENNVCIPESCISRKQCTIRRVPEGEWLIIDVSSFKSTLVNGSSLPARGLYVKSGDSISFGNLRTWRLIFYESPDDMPPLRKKRKPDDVEVSSQESHDSLSTAVLSGQSDGKLKPSGAVVKKSVSATKFVTKNVEVENREQIISELEEKVRELEKAKDQADDMLTTSVLDRKLLQSDYEDSCTEIDRLTRERESLLEELNESNKKNEASVNACGPSSQINSSEIESSLILKSIEVEELKDELTELKSKLETAQEVASCLSSEKERVYNDAVAIVEQEFLCCVCSDLLYKPVTLNCRHTFCSDCLKEWKKKKNECPSCRTKIKSEVKPLMIDNFIDRIAPLLGDEFVQKRQEAKSDRAAAPQLAPPPPPRQGPTPGTSYGAGGRGRRGSRRQRGRGNQPASNRGAPPPPPPAPGAGPDVIDLTSQSPGTNRRRNASDRAAEESSGEDSSDSLRSAIDVLSDVGVLFDMLGDSYDEFDGLGYDLDDDDDDELVIDDIDDDELDISDDDGTDEDLEIDDEEFEDDDIEF